MMVNNMVNNCHSRGEDQTFLSVHYILQRNTEKNERVREYAPRAMYVRGSYHQYKPQISESLLSLYS